MKKIEKYLKAKGDYNEDDEIYNKETNEVSGNPAQLNFGPVLFI
ncbi:MAG: hypothetical protein ACRC9V_10145 [Aeromonas sp.]